MIWAACLPSAHASVPASPPSPAGGPASAGTTGGLSSPAVPVADDRLRNQCDVAAPAACTVSLPWVSRPWELLPRTGTSWELLPRTGTSWEVLPRTGTSWEVLPSTGTS
jgi:hypothetical protein